MDWSLTPCTSTSTSTVPCTALWDLKRHNLVDRLSSLPDELLIHILSLLPTKDAVATSISSTKLRRVLPLVTNLDFDDSNISLCVKRPYAIEKYPTFITFVTSVLQGHQSECLNKFRLKVGSVGCHIRYYAYGCSSRSGCKQDCLPDLKSSQISAWISFPLSLCGLKELDLCILVREPGDAQLPTAIFTCQTLEVLKLEVNIGIYQVLAMSSYSLPSLKVLFFSVSFILDEGFLPRLLAGCPSLEYLKYEPTTEHVFNDVDLNVHKDQLPMFPNMKHLSIGGDFRDVFWDKLLLPLLNCSPLLETLNFDEGVTEDLDRDRPNLDEEKFLATAHPIPSCCRYHLKTIVIRQYMGKQRENRFVGFFLRHALVLENLIIHRSSSPYVRVSDKTAIESSLISLPKFSACCSIQVI